jgi:hypothetical protein
MSDNGHLDAQAIHARLNHPVIDADGHWLEYSPVMKEEFRKIGGAAAVEGLELAGSRVPNSLKMTVAERTRKRVGQEAFWGSPSENVRDRATAMMPKLMHERLAELGIDFAVVYPTAGLGYHRLQDTRMRRAICRAYNVFAADQFRGLDDRVIPAAIIPMYTPEEAIEEIEYAHKQLGYKVIMVGGMMRRQVPALAEERPDAASLVEWYDVVGIDSPHGPSCCATRRRTSATTTSATSPPPATPWPRPSSSAASRGDSPRSTSRSWRAGWAGRACSTRT